MAKSRNRKPAPKAAPRIDVVEDGKNVSVRSDGSEASTKRIRITSRKERTATSRRPGGATGSPVLNLNGDINAMTRSEAGQIFSDQEAKEKGAAAFSRAQEKDVTKDLTQGRRTQLDKDVNDLPGTATPRSMAKSGPFKVIPAEEAAGPAVGSRPIRGRGEGRKVTSPTGIVRTTLSNAEQRRTRRNAKNRRPAGVKTAVYDPNVTSESRDIKADSVKAFGRNTGTAVAAGGDKVKDPMKLGAADRRIHFAQKAREATVADVTKNVKQRGVVKSLKAAGMFGPGKNANANDIADAVQKGHITHEEAAFLNPSTAPKYIAEATVPGLESFHGSDLSMAHEVGHILKKDASHVASYAQSKGIGMKELRDTVVAHHRGEGKQTWWVPDEKDPSKKVPTYTNPSGTKQVRSRVTKSGANRTITKSLPSEQPTYTDIATSDKKKVVKKKAMPHLTYLRNEITRHIESRAEDRPEGRKRGTDPYVSPLTSRILSQNPDIKTSEVTEYSPYGEPKKYTQFTHSTFGNLNSEQVEREGTSVGRTKPKKLSIINGADTKPDNAPPKGAGGSFTLTEEGEEPKVVKPAVKAFKPVAKPKSRLRQ